MATGDTKELGGGAPTLEGNTTLGQRHTNKLIVVKCGDEEFQLTEEQVKKIPYLEALRSFKALSVKEDNTDEDREEITLESSIDPKLMKVVLKYVQTHVWNRKEGRMRSLFMNLPEGYTATELFELMDFLLMKKPSSTIADWGKRVQTFRQFDMGMENYPDGQCYAIIQRSTARDTAVEICWCAGEVVKNQQDELKLYNLIRFIMRRPRTFYYKTRKITLQWYLSHYQPSPSQLGILNKLLAKHPEEAELKENPKLISGGDPWSSDPEIYNESDYEFSE